MNRRELITAGLGLLGIGAPAAAVAEKPCVKAWVPPTPEEHRDDHLECWRQTAQWKYLHAGDAPDHNLFDNMIRCLPAEYRTGSWRERYGFYVHPDLIEAASWAYSKGTDGITRAVDFVYCRGVRGIRLVGVTSIPTHLPPVPRATPHLSQNAYTEAFLGNLDDYDPASIVWARDIRCYAALRIPRPTRYNTSNWLKPQGITESGLMRSQDDMRAYGQMTNVRVEWRQSA